MEDHYGFLCKALEIHAAKWKDIGRWKSGSSGLLGIIGEVRTLQHLRPCSLHLVSLDLEQRQLGFTSLLLLLFSHENFDSVFFYAS